MAGVMEKALDALELPEEPVPDDGSWMFSMGPGTFQVPKELHRWNRERLCLAFCALISDEEGDVIVLQGGQARCRDATDHEELFRQESFFQWCFGVREPDVLGVLEPKRQRATLFVPRLPAEYATWMGPIASLEQWRDRYGVDQVLYVDQMGDEPPLEGTTSVFYPRGVNSDSGVSNTAPVVDNVRSERSEKDFHKLFELMSELRTRKSKMEAEVMRYIGAVSSVGHVKVMQSIKPGMYEYMLESQFTHHCYAEGGCRYLSYTPICGSGANCATLHYGHAGAPNDKLISDGDMCLFDMGAEYHCYASDITCSFPANGKFSERQRTIYRAVLDAQNAVLAAVRPGVAWTDMHVLAERTILVRLRDAGLITGDVEDMVRDRVAAVFMPHGLGHMLGIDTHDVGGILTGHPPKSQVPGLKALRMTRTLLKNMVVTVEPGVYFNPANFKNARADPTLSKYLVDTEIDLYMDVGGVRIEDDILITDDGFEKLTDIPREIEDVEAVMAGGAWPRQ